MTNKQILITTAAAVALYVAISESARAENDCAADEVKGVNTGNCIKKTDTCGSGCIYTIDDKGNLNITGSGNGKIRNHAFDGNLDIVTVNIGAGITSTEYSVFKNATNLKSATIADTVTSLDSRYMFENCSNLEHLQLPSNLSYVGWKMVYGTKVREIQLPNTVTAIDNSLYWMPSSLKDFVMPESVSSISEPWGSSSGRTIYCTQAQIDGNVCSSTVTKYERDENGNLVVYNKDNTIKGIYNQYSDIVHDKVIDSYEKTDPQTGVVTKYNGRGQFLSSTWQDAAGSVYNFDANGNLKGLTKRGPFTIPEANALTKDGPVNTVTITW